MVECLKKYINIFLLIVFCVLGLVFFCTHTSNILIDIGREIYYPKAMLEGQILYKDLFNIYGPFAYQINSFLYFVFGAKLSTLYFVGGICSISVVLLIYKISKLFLSDKLSFVIGIFTAVIGIYTSSIFSFHFPYSWAMLYGIVAFLVSLLFLLKFDETKNNKYLYLSSLFCGICITCKYDFLIYSLVVLFFVFKNKNFKALLFFFFAPFVSFGILFLQGLRFSDLLQTTNILHSMAGSQTLKYFYQNSGVYFHPKALFTDFILFLKFILPFILFLFAAKIYSSKRLISFTIFIISFICFYIFFAKNYIFGFLPIFVVILTCLKFKTLNTSQKILLFSAISVSLKVFWVLLIGSYGTYYIPILLISLFTLFSLFINKKYENCICVFLLFICCLLIPNVINLYKASNFKLQTPNGSIYTTNQFQKNTNALVEYLQNLPNGETVIFPEGMFINFITNRKTDGFYNSLLPLYVESFSEEKIIEHFNKTKPEYIILNNLDMKDYYFRYICTDYAQDFCLFISENYKLKNSIGDELHFLIFRKK